MLRKVFFGNTLARAQLTSGRSHVRGFSQKLFDSSTVRSRCCTPLHCYGTAIRVESNVSSNFVMLAQTSESRSIDANLQNLMKALEKYNNDPAFVYKTV